MYCCGQCSLQSETTITAVVLVAPDPDRRKQKLKEFIQTANNSEANAYKYKELLNLNKENRQPNHSQLQSELKTRRRSIPPKITESFLLIEEDGAETGRFNVPGEPMGLMKNGESNTKRNCDSKTTSFGSRRSSAVFFREREVEVLQEELKRLREEGLRLHKEKLDKEYLYHREMSRVLASRDELRTSSRQRQADLSELRQLLRKHKKLSL